MKVQLLKRVEMRQKIYRNLFHRSRMMTKCYWVTFPKCAAMDPFRNHWSYHSLCETCWFNVDRIFVKFGVLPEACRQVLNENKLDLETQFDPETSAFTNIRHTIPFICYRCNSDRSQTPSKSREKQQTAD